VIAAFAALGSLAAAPHAAPVRLGTALVPAVADRATVERALTGSGVQRWADGPPRSYFVDLVGALSRAVRAAFEETVQALHLDGKAGRWLVTAALIVLGGALVVWLALQLWRSLRGRAKPSRAAAAAASAPASAPEAPRAAAALDAAAWRLDYERRLAAGDVQAATMALWWWLARSLAGPLAEPTWTGRELLARVRRDDLRGLVRRLDALAYGPRPATVAEVRQLAESFGTVLA
jgi:hypothetical protein